MVVAKLSKSNRKGKKYKVELLGKTVHFGASGYEDFTDHKDPKRKELYLSRHAKRENWAQHGMETAGFWARWLLWNKLTIEESKRDITRRFDIRFE